MLVKYAPGIATHISAQLYIFILAEFIQPYLAWYKFSHICSGYIGSVHYVPRVCVGMDYNGVLLYNNQDYAANGIDIYPRLHTGEIQSLSEDPNFI